MNNHTTSATSKASNLSTGSGEAPIIPIVLPAAIALLAVCGTAYLIWRKRKKSYHQW